ncbi:hypothetical protein PRIPAC_83046 [Pristionchus pacificus]|uniref:G protein-coupled receptor n=1 Tax=Pristionchus pacificus TaxID=54126 RepID=A0A2A6C4L2_PRIPA|nr:hypothetical protein PRIPAC_83046 [Pristionchus pacificus]|eukprot:PDM73079.1 G protein-coupled receptor [Pristionchus pacificus]
MSENGNPSEVIQKMNNLPRVRREFYDDDRQIAVCNPPEAFPRVVNNVRTQVGLVLGVIVLLLYLYIIYLLIRKSPTRTVKSSQIRAAKSMVALSATYLLSWFCTVTISFLATRMPLDSLFIRLYNQYAVLFALAAYSLTYYIHFLISREYRRAFLSNFCCRPFARPINHLFTSRHGSEITIGIPTSPSSRTPTRFILS